MKTYTLLIITLLSASMCFANFEFETTFNQPGFRGNSDLTVENKIIDLIKQAVPGSQIRAALYKASRNSVMRELVYASQRGVDVQIVLDGGNLPNASIPGHAISDLVFGFDGNQGLQCKEGEECVKFCQGPLAGVISKIKKGTNNYKLGESCRGLVINHNKFFLFSELSDGSKNVLVQTSQNFMEGQLKLYNDLIKINTDEAFYGEFINYWNKLKGDKTVLLKKSFPTVSNSDQTVKAYFFPRLVGSDPVKNLLKRANCKLPNSKIRVLHSVLTRSGVAEQLKRLKNEGCQLEVIARADAIHMSPSKKIRELLSDSLILMPFRGKSEEEINENSFHTKIIIMNLSLDNAQTNTPIVLTGSHNLDLFSLKANDEVMLEIHDQKLFDQYDVFIDGLLSEARSSGMQFLPVNE